jgi:hypothetical protein
MVCVMYQQVNIFEAHSIRYKVLTVSIMFLWVLIVWNCRQTLTFRRNILLPSPALKTEAVCSSGKLIKMKIMCFSETLVCRPTYKSTFHDSALKIEFAYFSVPHIVTNAAK